MSEENCSLSKVKYKTSWLDRNDLLGLIVTVIILMHFLHFAVLNSLMTEE
jgi:hypothetical protein